MGQDIIGRTFNHHCVWNTDVTCIYCYEKCDCTFAVSDAHCHGSNVYYSYENVDSFFVQ